jgi:hypothetical protein
MRLLFCGVEYYFSCLSQIVGNRHFHWAFTKLVIDNLRVDDLKGIIEDVWLVSERVGGQPRAEN